LVVVFVVVLSILHSCGLVSSCAAAESAMEMGEIGEHARISQEMDGETTEIRRIWVHLSTKIAILKMSE